MPFSLLLQHSDGKAVIFSLDGSVLISATIISTVYLIMVKVSIVGACEQGYYTPSNTADCQQCSQCSEKEGILQPCTDTANTMCMPCAQGYTYSALTTTIGDRQCLNCTNCSALHREQITPCNTTADSVCGDCTVGYFLGVAAASGNTVCMQCSRCPDGNVAAVRWQDCEKGGLDRDMWCAPGYTETTEFSAAATAAPTSTTNDLFLGSESFVDFHNLGDSGNPSNDKNIDSFSTTLVVISLAGCMVLAVLIMAFLIAIILRRKYKWRRNLATYTPVSPIQLGPVP